MTVFSDMNAYVSLSVITPSKSKRKAFFPVTMLLSLML